MDLCTCKRGTIVKRQCCPYWCCDSCHDALKKYIAHEAGVDLFGLDRIHATWLR